MRRLTALVATVLALNLAGTAVVGAQRECSFILGFAAAAAALGPEVVGDCVEQQYVLDAPLKMAISGGSVSLRAGATVQQTTRGTFVWAPEYNAPRFITWGGLWVDPGNGIMRYATWDEARSYAARPAANPPMGAAAASAPPPSTPPRSQWTDTEEAQFQCSTRWANALARSVGIGMPQAEMDRRKAEADAIRFLCDSTAASHGTRGVECFDKAWEAARGMERVFPGSGRKAYDDAFAVCIAGR